MTKQEKIQEAYGEYWKICNPDENGWTKSEGNLTFIDWEDVFELYEYPEWGYNGEVIGCEKWRPKCLQGIENNNGWIKIESEDDLPKIKGNYLVIDKFLETNPSIAFYDPKAVIFLMSSWYERYSHYQLIVNPQPPIY